MSDEEVLSVSRPVPAPNLRREGVVAVVRTLDVDRLDKIVEALIAGGITTVEVTLTIPDLMSRFEALRSRFDGAAVLGVGTVQTVAQARAVVEHGARFVVTPTTVPAVINAVVVAGVPIFPGGLSPTELATGWNLGVTGVKVFPASQVGPGYIGQLRGPFPDIEVMPSGGIEEADIGPWISAGALAVSLGGPLIRDASEGGDLAALSDRARSAVREVARCREGER